MMTAEQLPISIARDRLVGPGGVLEALDEAAAQLAEKEREIERLKSLVMSLRPSTLEARAEAAEQRLQEAQAQLETLKNNAVWDAPNGCTFHQTAQRLAGELRQREAELEQRWIAVGERLPEVNVNILASDRQGRFSVGHLKPGGAWNFAKAISIVTHWQPLPSPPKEAQ